MRFPALVGALAVPLIASSLAFTATRTGAAARPDLVVSSISNPPGVVVRGASFPVRDRTRNVGSAWACATVTRYFFAAKGQRTAAGRRAVVRLLPHRSSTGVATAKVPLTLAPGTLLHGRLRRRDAHRSEGQRARQLPDLGDDRRRQKTAAAGVETLRPTPT